MSLEQQTLSTELTRLQSELMQAKNGLPLEFRLEYERIAKARGENALAEVRGGDVRELLSDADKVQTMNELYLARPVFCKTCGLPDVSARRPRPVGEGESVSVLGENLADTLYSRPHFEDNTDTVRDGSSYDLHMVGGCFFAAPRFDARPVGWPARAFRREKLQCPIAFP